MSVRPPNLPHAAPGLFALLAAASLLASTAFISAPAAAREARDSTRAGAVQDTADSSRVGPAARARLESRGRDTAATVPGVDTVQVATMGVTKKQSPWKRKRKPNVLLITTDDQTLADLSVMPRTRRRIGNLGVRFTGLATHPLCCPARAMMLTGQHAQNNGVRSNGGRYGGYKRLDTRRTVGAWMNGAGYRTIFMGKFLNGYSKPQAQDRMPGWDDWNATVGGVYNYQRFTVSHNGRLRAYTRYQTDFYTDLAVKKITQNARNSTRPFFLWQSYVAPHTRCGAKRETRSCWRPPTPPERHRGLFGSAEPPSWHKPSYNEPDVSDKPHWIRTKQMLSGDERSRVLHSHRQRLRSLRSVDQGVDEMLDALARTGQLQNTLVIFTSDNGFLNGEHREIGKTVPYEEALRVPFLMRGPGIPRDKTLDVFATHADIAPTIAGIGRAKPGRTVDGRNLLPAARRGAPTYDTVLIQGGPHRKRYARTGWFYRGVRTHRYTYAYYPRDREHELYDRAHDPHQLTNVANDVRYISVVGDLQRRLHELQRCAGVSCRTRFGPDPRPASGKPEQRPARAFRYVDRR